MTTKMKKMRKRHERCLKTFRKQEAGWEQRREVFARLDEAKQKAIRKHGGLNKIGWGALAEINQESSLRYVRKYCLEKEALKATQNQLSLQLGWHDVERESGSWAKYNACVSVCGIVNCVPFMVISRLNLGVRP